MVRRLDADHLVRVPVLDIADSVALGTALETRVQASVPLPEPIEEAWEELASAHAKVKTVHEKKVHEESNGRPLVQVDRSLDSSWVAGHDLCKAWLRLPVAVPKQDAARRIDEAVYKNGVAFTQLNCRDQWVESQSRLDIIEERGLEQDFNRLGAGEMLAAIRMYHQEYGNVQGLTAVHDEDVPGALASLQEFRAALRYYALQVAAHARPSDPASQDLSRTLLMPLTTWQSRRRTSAEDETPAQGEDDAPASNAPPSSDTPASDAPQGSNTPASGSSGTTAG